MPKNLLGIEIGSTNIKIVEAEKKGKTWHVVNSAFLPTPLESIRDGEIVEMDKMVEVLRPVLSKRGFKAKNVALLIKGSSIVIRDAVMRAQNDKQVEEQLKRGTSEYLPIDTSNYQVDYKIVGTTLEDGEVRSRVMLVAAPNTIVFGMITLAERLKLNPISINIATDAICLAFSEEKGLIKNPEKNALVIDIGGQSVTITIISGGAGVITRNIPFGFNTINDIITKEFGAKSTAEVEAFKQQYAAVYDSPEDGEEDLYGTYISNSIKPTIDQHVIGEINRTIQFYYSRATKENMIKQVYLIGGGAKLKGLDRYIQNALNIPTKRIDSFDKIIIEPKVELLKDASYFVNVLGLISGI